MVTTKQLSVQSCLNAPATGQFDSFLIKMLAVMCCPVSSQPPSPQAGLLIAASKRHHHKFKASKQPGYSLYPANLIIQPVVCVWLVDVCVTAKLHMVTPIKLTGVTCLIVLLDISKAELASGLCFPSSSSLRWHSDCDILNCYLCAKSSLIEIMEAVRQDPRTCWDWEHLLIWQCTCTQYES